MALNNTWNKDKKDENIINEKYLFPLMRQAGWEIKEATLEEDMAGCDVKLKNEKIFGDDNFHNVDIKCVKSAYKKNTENLTEKYNNLTFELVGNSNVNSEGWLFNKEKYHMTEYMLFIFPYGTTEKFNPYHINKFEWYLFKKQDLLDLLNNKYGFNREVFNTLYREKMVKFKTNEKHNGLFLCCSRYLYEKPINVLVPKDDIEKISIIHRGRPRGVAF